MNFYVDVILIISITIIGLMFFCRFAGPRPRAGGGASPSPPDSVTRSAYSDGGSGESLREIWDEFFASDEVKNFMKLDVSSDDAV